MADKIPKSVFSNPVAGEQITSKNYNDDIEVIRQAINDNSSLIREEKLQNVSKEVENQQALQAVDTTNLSDGTRYVVKEDTVYNGKGTGKEYVTYVLREDGGVKDWIVDSVGVPIVTETNDGIMTKENFVKLRDLPTGDVINNEISSLQTTTAANTAAITSNTTDLSTAKLDINSLRNLKQDKALAPNVQYFTQDTVEGRILENGLSTTANLHELERQKALIDALVIKEKGFVEGIVDEPETIPTGNIVPTFDDIINENNKTDAGQPTEFVRFEAIAGTQTSPANINDNSRVAFYQNGNFKGRIDGNIIRESTGTDVTVSAWIDVFINGVEDTSKRVPLLGSNGVLMTATKSSISLGFSKNIPIQSINAEGDIVELRFRIQTTGELTLEPGFKWIVEEVAQATSITIKDTGDLVAKLPAQEGGANQSVINQSNKQVADATVGIVHNGNDTIIDGVNIKDLKASADSHKENTINIDTLTAAQAVDKYNDKDSISFYTDTNVGGSGEGIINDIAKGNPTQTPQISYTGWRYSPIDMKLYIGQIFLTYNAVDGWTASGGVVVESDFHVLTSKAQKDIFPYLKLGNQVQVEIKSTTPAPVNASTITKYNIKALYFNEDNTQAKCLVEEERLVNNHSTKLYYDTEIAQGFAGDFSVIAHPDPTDDNEVIVFKDIKDKQFTGGNTQADSIDRFLAAPGNPAILWNIITRDSGDIAIQGSGIIGGNPVTIGFGLFEDNAGTKAPSIIYTTYENGQEKNQYIPLSGIHNEGLGVTIAEDNERFREDITEEMWKTFLNAPGQALEMWERKPDGTYDFLREDPQNPASDPVWLNNGSLFGSWIKDIASFNAAIKVGGLVNNKPSKLQFYSSNISMGGTKISGVNDGTFGTDAATVHQLNRARQKPGLPNKPGSSIIFEETKNIQLQTAISQVDQRKHFQDQEIPYVYAGDTTATDTVEVKIRIQYADSKGDRFDQFYYPTFRLRDGNWLIDNGEQLECEAYDSKGNILSKAIIDFANANWNKSQKKFFLNFNQGTTLPTGNATDGGGQGDWFGYVEELVFLHELAGVVAANPNTAFLGFNSSEIDLNDINDPDRRGMSEKRTIQRMSEADAADGVLGGMTNATFKAKVENSGATPKLKDISVGNTEGNVDYTNRVWTDADVGKKVILTISGLVRGPVEIIGFISSELDDDGKRYRISIEIKEKKPGTKEYDSLTWVWNDLKSPSKKDLIDVLGYTFNAQNKSIISSFSLETNILSFKIEE